ncbi:MAG: S8 family serine peptidase, partial [Calditrichia bacterium]|nr:S8 family serine peptidase [Calditrichia bacterium]
MRPVFLMMLTALAAGIIFSSAQIRAQSGPAKIHPYLQAMLNTTQDGELIPVYIMLGDRLSLQDLQSMAGHLKRRQRRAEVVRILKEHAAATQGRVLSYLENARRQGLIGEHIENVWSINVIAFQAKPAAVYALAGDYPEIEQIRYDRPISREEAQDDLGISRYNEENNINLGPSFAPQQGLVLIRAPLVWAEGDSGQGVILANVDGGAEWRHPDLVKNLWNNLGEDANGNGKTVIFNGSSWVFDPGDVNGVDDDGNGKVDDFIGWNFSNNSNDPSTASNSHGTSTAGILVGDGTNGTQTGVAPRAKLMDLNINSAGESGWWAAYQYAFENGADVTTSSFSAKWYFSPQPNYPMFRQTNDMELAAGTLHTNSTSNDGNSTGIPFNISAPGCTPGPWIHPDQTL